MTGRTPVFSPTVVGSPPGSSSRYSRYRALLASVCARSRIWPRLPGGNTRGRGDSGGLQGSVDHAELSGDAEGIRRLRGWAFAVEDAGVPLEVSVSVNGVAWGRGSAKHHRADLTAVHPTGNCAFDVELRLPLVASGEMLAGDTVQVWVRHPTTGETARLPLTARVSGRAPVGARRIAAFTMVYNEPVNLPI
jgi:hypothetical protein